MGEQCPMCGTPLDGDLSEALEEYRSRGTEKQQAEFADAMEWYFSGGGVPEDYQEYLEWKESKSTV